MNQPASLTGTTSEQQTPGLKSQMQAEFMYSFYLHATLVKEPNLEVSLRIPENEESK